MGELKIAVTVDENYVYPLRVMLHSLFSTQKTRITIYLVHTRIHAQTVRELKKFCSGYNATLRELKVEHDIFENAPTGMYFTKEMYYRIILPWLLPEENRILYLDPDIIINGSLKSLWNTEMNGAALAGIKDRTVMLCGTNILKYLKEDTIYINSGVLLMDLKRIRKENNIKEILSLLNERDKELTFQDQDLINLLWEGHIKYVSETYNMNPNFLYLKEFIGISWKKYSWKVVHFMCADKPWKKGYRGNAYLLWAKAEWHVYPQNRLRIFGRILLEPYRHMLGYYNFLKNHIMKSKS